MTARKIRSYIESVNQTLLQVDRKAIEQVLDLLKAAFCQKRAVFVIGNGGSASNASHLAQDLSKGALPELEGRRRFRVMSLVDNMAFLTAIANDMGYERVFEFQLRQFAKKGDVLIAISGSGNSPNILRAAEWAKEAGLSVVCATGFDGGKLRGMADIALHVPCDDMCKTEAVHSTLFHLIVDLLRDRLKEGPGGSACKR